MLKKITKRMIISFLIDVKGYEEEEAKHYLSINGTKEIKNDLKMYYI